MTLNYFGNGTFIGIIAPYESQKVQMGGDSRGIRYRVAIMGKHPFGDGELADTDLPFASVFSYGGTGAANVYETQKYSQGDIVFGVYLDEKQQQPEIMAPLARVKDIKYGSGRFEPKTGFVGGIQPANLQGRQEFNEQNPPCTPLARLVNDISKMRFPNYSGFKDLGIDYSGAAFSAKVNAFPAPPVLPPPITNENSVMQDASQGLSDPGNPNSPVIGSEVGG
tara:strand:- start:2000 stop:2668 length:669 start_codon:yes stop_codon:yes gene_type:complete